MKKLTPTERTARLLALIPWVAARGEVASIEELEARFDYPRELLLSDLATLRADLLADDDNSAMATVDIDWGHQYIMISCPTWISDPRRLSADEAAKLLAIGKAALKLHAWNEPLSEHQLDDSLIAENTALSEDTSETPALVRALLKLRLMLDDTKRGLNTRRRIIDRLRSGEMDIENDVIMDISLGHVPRSTIYDLTRAINERLRVDLGYYSYNRDAVTSRAVDPARLFSQFGTWYLSGWCHLARDKRTFRVDRISSLRVTDEAVTFDIPVEYLSNFVPDEEAHKVRLRLGRRARWVAESYPIAAARELEQGELEVDLNVTSLPWLARLLVKLGGEAEVVTGDPDLASLRASSAARILERYR